MKATNPSNHFELQVDSKENKQTMKIFEDASDKAYAFGDLSSKDIKLAVMGKDYSPFAFRKMLRGVKIHNIFGIFIVNPPKNTSFWKLSLENRLSHKIQRLNINLESVKGHEKRKLMRIL